ncbi:hypothetical protein Tco_1531127 [Tanacetum coccineum]
MLEESPNFRWRNEDDTRPKNGKQYNSGYKPRYDSGGSSNYQQQHSYQQRPQQQYQNHGQGQGDNHLSNLDQKFDKLMDLISKSNQKVNQKFETNNKSIAALERQVGQLADQLNKRDDGKLPSYTYLNQGHKKNGNEHVNMVTSLRSDEKDKLKHIVVEELNNDKNLEKPLKMSFETNESPKVGEDGVKSTTTPYPSALEKPASSPFVKEGLIVKICENEELLEVEEVQQIEEHMASSLDQQRPPWSYKVKAIPHSANDSLPVIITSDILGLQEEALLKVLTKYKEAIGWTIIDLKGISPSLCMHKTVTEPQINPSRDAQRRVNHNMRNVVKKEVLKWLDVGIIYPISDSKWVSLTQTVPKKAGITIIETKS